MTAIKVVQKFFPKVKRVIDATSNAIIEVTSADAHSSGIKKHSECAMAVACKRKFHLDGVIISRSIAYLVKGTRARKFRLPESVSREVISFDRGSEFAPGNYELSKIPPSSRSGRPQDKRISHARKFNTPIKHRHITTNVRTVLGGMKPNEKPTGEKTL